MTSFEDDESHQVIKHEAPQFELDDNESDELEARDVDPDAYIVPDDSSIPQNDSPTVEIIPKVKDGKSKRKTKKTVSKLETERFPALPVAIVATTVVAATALVVRWLSRRSHRGVVLKANQVFLEKLNISSKNGTTGKLKGKTIAVSDRFDVQGLSTRCGSSTWQAAMPCSQSSATIINLLTAAGATITATVPTEPLGLGPFLFHSHTTLPNPIAKGHVHGGGEYGAAISTAANLVDVAVAVDVLGSALIPAACCGTFALRLTQGSIPSTGSFIDSPSIAAVALVSKSPEALLTTGQALKLPSRSSGGVLTTYLVAEDLFAACGSQVHEAMPAVVGAVKRWAGADQAQGLSLCEWLYHRFLSLQAFYPPHQSTNDNNSTSSKTRVDLVLEALGRAAEVIKLYEVNQMVGYWGESNASNLDSAITTALSHAATITAEEYQKAIAVSQELSEGFRAALQENIFVIPTLHDAPPKLNSKDISKYKTRCLQLAALASLSQAPQLAIPVASSQGTMPLSVSLLGLHRSDMSLVHAAIKLAPMLNQEYGRLKQGGRPSTSSVFASNGSNHRSASGRQLNKKPDAETLALASAAKESGNTAFKAGKYDEAIRQYSEAIRLDPRNAVYYNNRALVYLKTGNLSAAEEDCDAALELDPTAVKALLRRGSARLARGDTNGAKEDFERVVKIEPNNKQAISELNRLKEFMEMDEPVLI